MQRIFIPGSNWLYIKIYTSPKTIDKILINAINKVLCELKNCNLYEKWFFIRYTDPDLHIRVRLLLRDELSLGKILHLFYKRLNPYIEDNQIWKIQLDTYNRELERYSRRLIEETESIFYVDSESILTIIKKLNESKDENYRWMAALKMIDAFLSDFSLDINRKHQLMNQLSDSFKSEFGFNQHNAKQFNTKFRENKPIVESVLNDTISDEGFLLISKLIKRRSKQFQPVVQQITDKLRQEKSDILTNLLISYIHMTLNRLFRSKNRIHELIIYDFMYRYYTSELAKIKYNNTK
ncbi:hypothetical protein FACS189413_18040 [Bacteroidia bacterium]|nr:hypothetical protein FACS189413_18040 [Bacteroidia bacterium]